MNAEETTCALKPDKHPRVKHWVHNLERNLSYAFSLLTSGDCFFGTAQ